MKNLRSFAAAAIFFTFIIPASSETIVALMSDKKLRHFSSAAPNAWLKTVDITGLPVAESVEALDFRPDGTLFVITVEGGSLRTYSIDPNSGVATRAGAVAFNPANAAAAAFDAFSPDVHSHYLALATQSDFLSRYFALGGSSGTTADKPLFFDNSASDGDPADLHSGTNPSIVALGSTNGFVGARVAALYGIDSLQNALVKIDWDTGSMDTVAALRDSGGAAVSVVQRAGFDISGVTGIAYLSTGSTPTNLFTVDLTTGLTVTVGPIGPPFQTGGALLMDISTLPPTDVNNISTRSRVGTGDDVMIAGFISQGGASNRLLIRGLGPSLTALGVSGALADPILTVKDANGEVIAINDNWKSTQQNEIAETGLQPGNEYDAAYLGVFPPGLYTAIVSGYAGGAGVSLVEIYKLPDL
jgi:hypothetical protein